MESPCSWTVFCILIIFSIQIVNVFCQNESRDETPRDQTRDLKRDISKQFFSPSGSNIQDDRPKLINIPSQTSSQYIQEPAIFNQFVGPNNIPNLGLSTQYPTILPESQPCYSAPGNPLDNYSNMVPPMPAVWQFSTPSQSTSDVYNYPTMIPQITSSFPSPVITNTYPNNIEVLNKANEIAITQDPSKFQNGCEDGIPRNLQINIPYQNLPVPTVTVITSNSNAGPIHPYYQPPQQPVTVKKSKSSMKSILPILLIALLSDQGCCGNCCCNNNSPILIPYPIPIPINNPIVNNDNSSLSSDRGNTESASDNDEDSDSDED